MVEEQAERADSDCWGARGLQQAPLHRVLSVPLTQVQGDTVSGGISAVQLRLGQSGDQSQRGRCSDEGETALGASGPTSHRIPTALHTEQQSKCCYQQQELRRWI